MINNLINLGEQVVIFEATKSDHTFYDRSYLLQFWVKYGKWIELNPPNGIGLYTPQDFESITWELILVSVNLFQCCRELADFTKDGKVDRLEFAIAMKLIKLKLQGNTLPKILPASMKKQTAKFDISSFGKQSMQSNNNKF